MFQSCNRCQSPKGQFVKRTADGTLVLCESCRWTPAQNVRFHKARYRKHIRVRVPDLAFLDEMSRIREELAVRSDD